MPFMRRLAVLSLLALLASGCSPRRKAESMLKKVNHSNLREEAAVLYKQTFAGSSAPPFTAIKPDDWPANFRAFTPRHVGAFKDGFSLALKLEGGVESGIYVVPKFMDVQPNPGRRAKFEKLDDGIYWYSFEK